jgi:hypothetical protein
MNILKLLFSGVFQKLLAQDATVQADINLAIDKTIAALNACSVALQSWKLVNQRIQPMVTELKNSE